MTDRADTNARTARLRNRLGALRHKMVDVASAMVFELVQLATVAVTFPIITRAFGPATYGEFTTMYVIAGYASTWVSLAGGAASVQLLLQHQRSARSVVRAGRRQVLISSMPLSIVGIAASVVLFGPDLLVPALLVFGGDLLLGGFANIYISAAYALRGVAMSSRIRIVQPVMKLFGVLLLVIIGNVTLFSVVAVNTLAVVVMAVVSWLILRLHDQMAAAAAAGNDTTPAELLRYTGMYAATISANATQDEGEKIVLASLRPVAEVGEYQAAYRIVELALTPLKAVNASANRWFLVHDDRPGIQTERAWRMSRVIGLYGLVCVVVIVVGRNLVHVLIGDDFDLAIEMVVWLSAFPLVRALADVPVLGLLALNRNKPRMFLGLGGAAFALACYLVLVPLFGWRGGVIGTYLSEVATLIGGWILLRRYQRQADEGHPELVSGDAQELPTLADPATPEESDE